MQREFQRFDDRKNYSEIFVLHSSGHIQLVELHDAEYN